MGQQYRFKDLTGLTRWTMSFFWLLILMRGVSLIFWGLRAAADAGSLDAATGRSDWFTEVHALIFFTAPLIYIISWAFALRWIHRANRNVRTLGAQGMAFTPFWSVGWFLVPIVNLWQTHHIIRELWQTSSKPNDWNNQPVSPLVRLWWATMVASVSMYIAFLPVGAIDTDFARVLSAGMYTWMPDIVDIGHHLVFLRLLTGIRDLQLSHTRLPGGFPADMAGGTIGRNANPAFDAGVPRVPAVMPLPTVSYSKKSRRTADR